MSAHPAEISAGLTCHQCGYDLRVHPPDGNCPECGTSVAESRRLAAYPLRPAWRDSDPRWRRRILAGTWTLVLLPLICGLMSYHRASHVSVPTPFDYRGPLGLDETFLANPYVYQPLIFCIGVVLLFSKERGRRRNRLDWTRPWGVLCSYVVLLLCAAPILYISALVLAGIAAAFQSMPLKLQPPVTQLLANVSTAYLRHGPSPKSFADVVLVAFSSITILLACVALFDALRSTGPKHLALILLAPLPLFALLHIAHAGLFYSGLSNVIAAKAYGHGIYFRPDLLVDGIEGFPSALYGPRVNDFLIEAAKWCIFLAIATWLTIAQFAPRRGRQKTSPA